MGKQRIPQGQRPGRRMPVRRGPAGTAGLAASNEAPTDTLAETVTDAEPAPQPAAPDHEVASVETETVEAAPAASEMPAAEASSVSEAEEAAADEEPASEIGTEPDGVPEAVSAWEEPAAVAEVPAEIVAAEPAEQAASDEASTEVPAVDAVLPDPLLPVAALAAAEPLARAKPRLERAAFRFAFIPARLDVEGIGVVLANYMHNESVAAMSYMRALSAARSPADMIRLNVTEMQRAADASLTCWSDIARRAARGVPLH